MIKKKIDKLNETMLLRLVYDILGLTLCFFFFFCYTNSFLDRGHL